jgi:hypothetical protein
LCRFRAKCQAIAWFCAIAANLDASSGAERENASTGLTVVHHRDPVLKRGQRVKHFSERSTGPATSPCSRVLRNLSGVLRRHQLVLRTFSLPDPIVRRRIPKRAKNGTPFGVRGGAAGTRGGRAGDSGARKLKPRIRKHAREHGSCLATAAVTVPSTRGACAARAPPPAPSPDFDEPSARPRRPVPRSR